MQRVQHVGWTIAGVKNPESVAEHTARAVQIGYILAKMEKADAYKVAVMCIFHDIGEVRINDAHRIANRYLGHSVLKEAEMKSFIDQANNLPAEIRDNLINIFSEFEAKETIEAKYAKDADYLDQALSAKEYIDIGYSGCKDWILNIKKALKTETAKKLLEIIEKTDRNEWWANLKDFAGILDKDNK